MSKRHLQQDDGDAAISTQEQALFRDAMDTVQPLPQDARRHRPEHTLPSARPRQSEADAEAVMHELLDAPPVDIETGDSMAWRRDGVQLTVLRKLRRGHYRCQAELDLHGLVVATARRELAQFLHEAHVRHHRCIRIVHGKGLRSGQRGPVLKGKVAGWLRRRDDVLAYCSAPDHDGGTGAVYVLLRTT